MKMVRYFITVGVLLLSCTVSWCQQKDTLPPAIRNGVMDTLRPAPAVKGKKSGNMDSPYKVDSTTRKKHDPRKATLYSAFCPGLGQIYNHKYWKLPLVYAAVGIPVYTFFYNKSWYQKCQQALSILADTPLTNDKLAKVDPKLRVFVSAGDNNDLISYRNSFRQDQDYSVLFFLLFWGLQVVDATVDAHLMDFDVSSELSMKLQPGPGAANQTGYTGYSMGNTTGISLVFDIHKAKYKPIPLP